MLSLCVLVASLSADPDWSQFRGPTGQGVTNAELPQQWSETEHVAWSLELPGVGHSSPIVAGETAWLTTAAKDGSWNGLLAVDLKSGRLVRDLKLFEPTDIHEIHKGNTYASPTPCSDGERVYAHFGRYGTAAVEIATGEVLWRNDEIHVEHRSGPASSPILAGGHLILVFDAVEESFVCGLDVATGRLVWKTPRSAPLRPAEHMHRAFSTPLKIIRDGREFVVVPGPDQLNAYDAATGAEQWHVRYTGFSTVPAPVADEQRVYFCTGFYDPELMAITLDDLFAGDDDRGDVSASHLAWKYDGAVPDTPSPTLVGNRVYLVSNTGRDDRSRCGHRPAHQRRPCPRQRRGLTDREWRSTLRFRRVGRDECVEHQRGEAGLAGEEHSGWRRQSQPGGRGRRFARPHKRAAGLRDQVTRRRRAAGDVSRYSTGGRITTVNQ